LPWLALIEQTKSAILSVVSFAIASILGVLLLALNGWPVPDALIAVGLSLGLIVTAQLAWMDLRH